MATNPTLSDFYKLVTTAGTPVALGTSGTTFQTVTFVGCKAAKTDNTGTVYIRYTGGTGWIPLGPGAFITINSTTTRPLTAAQFEIDSATNGDGVLAMTQQQVGYDGP